MINTPTAALKNFADFGKTSAKLRQSFGKLRQTSAKVRIVMSRLRRASESSFRNFLTSWEGLPKLFAAAWCLAPAFRNGNGDHGFAKFLEMTLAADMTK